MTFKRFSIIAILMLALNTFFSSFAFANTNGDNCQCSIIALGDSITFGTSLGPNEKPFPSLIGKLGAKENSVTNLGVPGQTSGELLASLNSHTASLKGADVITLYIGGNDLLQATGLSEILTNSTLESLTPEKLAELTEKAETIFTELPANLNGIMNKIREQNGSAPIVLYNLYNPIPNSADKAELALLHQFGNQIISMINTSFINPIAQQYDNVYLADAFTAFSGKQSQYITVEFPQLGIGVHPNAAGHRALAKLADGILKPLFPEKVLTVTLTQTPEESTKGPVTVKVETNAESVQAMKWLSGTKTVQDFQTAGNEIKDASFQVAENGIYTVYVKDECDRESAATIEIKNIQKEEPAPKPDGPNNPAPKPDEPNNPTPKPEDTNTQTPTPVTDSTPKPVTVKTATTSGHKLPDTASPLFNYIAIGLALAASGLIALKLQQNNRKENI